MPRNLFQEVVFTVMMVVVMVYAMICYNIALDMGGMTNIVFKLALHEMLYMCPIAFALELLVVGRLAKGLAFRFVTPGVDKPLFIILAISSMTVLLMCPTMSAVATALIKQPTSNFVAVWVQTTILNFPMALLWQIFAAGPVVRRVFGLIFRVKEEAPSDEEPMAA